jgi:hypothetical protein
VSSTFSAESLVRLPVRWNGIELGRPVDVVLDADGRRVLGLDVRCGDERRRFLPIGAATIGETEIAVPSALLLFGEDELEFYRRRGRALVSRRGLAVQRGSRVLGELVDVLLTADGTIVELVVEGAPAEPIRVALTNGVRVVRAGKAA